MKRFVWRLQRVLDIKTKEEHIVKAQLVKLTEKLIGVRSELLVQKGILNNLISDISEESPKARLGKQELFLKCSKTNSEIIKKLTEKVNELVLAQKLKNAEVVKVKQLRKGLEKLRTEAKLRFIEKEEKLEQKELDEMATVAFARKKLYARS